MNFAELNFFFVAVQFYICFIVTNMNIRFMYIYTVIFVQIKSITYANFRFLYFRTISYFRRRFEL